MGYRYTIKQLPPNERPRERLLVHGAEALTDTELVALVLATGSKAESALDLARRLLVRFPLDELIQVQAEELLSLSGVGAAKAARLKAAVELAKRINAVSVWDKPVIEGPRKAAELVMEDLRHRKREHFRVLLLDTKNRLIKQRDVHIGTANSSLVHPREVFREAVRSSAVSCILVHNHPSGDPTPSHEDITITQRLVQAGEIVGIDVLDHIIIGDRKFLSFKQKGII